MACTISENDYMLLARDDNGNLVAIRIQDVNIEVDDKGIIVKTIENENVFAYYCGGE